MSLTSHESDAAPTPPSYSLWHFKKLPEPAVVVAAALVGLVVYLLIAPT
jgi:hypothetical protein